MAVNFSNEIAVVRHDRCLLTTSIRLSGVGPLGTRAGDVVYIVAGSQHPCSLRPLPSSSRTRTFTLIGICSVYGIKDGEAVNHAAAVDSGHLKPEWQGVYFD